MLLGQISTHDNLKVFPVYFDISSHDDVHLFLSGQRSYALPPHLENLCSALCSKDDFYIELGFHDNEMAQKIDELNGAIKIMEQNHEGYANSNFTETSL